jgi:hypothetical protein
MYILKITTPKSSYWKYLAQENFLKNIKPTLLLQIVDETTDVAGEKILCLMIKYFSCKKNKILTTFYRLILVEKCNAQGLHDCVTNQLIKDNLQIKILVSIGVDGANVMVGTHHSFATLTKSLVPDLIVL